MESNQCQANGQDSAQAEEALLESPHQATPSTTSPRSNPTSPESTVPVVVINSVVFSPPRDARAPHMLPTSSSLDEIPPPKADYYAPPPYEEATKVSKLPTYEEVQIEKHLEEAGLSIPINSPNIDLAGVRPPQRRILTLDNDLNRPDDVDTTLLGTDFMFYVAFFVAFIFNWIGFLLLMCFCHTIASRYGALSGFGLSLAKWTFIVQHSTELASKENSWLWWLIMTFGLIICIRAILQYLSIKRGWHMLSASHQERLLFFY